MAAYDLTGDRRYLEAAQAIFAHNTAAGTAPAAAGCGGTRRAPTRTRSPTSCSSRSRRCCPSGAPMAGATGTGRCAEWEWLRASGMIGPAGLVNDGLTAGCAEQRRHHLDLQPGRDPRRARRAVRDHRRPGLPARRARRSRTRRCRGLARRRASSPNRASRPAATATRRSSRASSSATCTSSGGTAASPATAAFILANADSVWDHARNVDTQSGLPQFGLHWAGPFDVPTPARQSSALDLLTAAAALAP